MTTTKTPTTVTLNAPERLPSLPAYVQFEPGNGTRFDIYLADLNGSLLVSIINFQSCYIFSHATSPGYVGEKLRLRGSDAAYVSDLINRQLEDPTEPARRELVREINAEVKSQDSDSERERLEALHGKGNVWNTTELNRDFEVRGFMAPFCIVRQRITDRIGSVEFQHSPRFYFNFRAD
jgi:hypothetical protein